MFGGKKFKRKDGKEITLLSPKGKGKKYAAELRTGMHFRNDGEYKPDKNGEIGLTKEQRAYRSGYLDARKDIGKAFEARNKKSK